MDSRGRIGNLDLDFVARVKRYAKKNNTTLGGVVTTIVVAALKEGFGETLDYPAPLPRGRKPGVKSKPKRKQRSKNLATQVLDSKPDEAGQGAGPGDEITEMQTPDQDPDAIDEDAEAVAED
jgi:hypothetical protein